MKAFFAVGHQIADGLLLDTISADLTNTYLPPMDFNFDNLGEAALVPQRALSKAATNARLTENSFLLHVAMNLFTAHFEEIMWRNFDVHEVALG